jgi:hypothetical protein
MNLISVWGGRGRMSLNPAVLLKALFDSKKALPCFFCVERALWLMNHKTSIWITRISISRKLTSLLCHRGRMSLNPAVLLKELFDSKKALPCFFCVERALWLMKLARESYYDVPGKGVPLNWGSLDFAQFDYILEDVVRGLSRALMIISCYRSV